MTLFVFICVSVGAAISIKSLIILNCPVFIGMERLEELFSFSEQESSQLRVGGGGGGGGGGGRLEELFSFSEQESYQLQVTPPPPPSTHLNPVKVSNMVIYLISCL